MLLGSTSTPCLWNGPHVVAAPTAGEQPEQRDGCWWVIAHRLDAIIDALAAANGSAPDQTALQAIQAMRKLGLEVLVAEDNPINQAILRDQLEQLGCQSVIAADGREALAYCRERPFSLLLTDLNMPVMDGFALATSIGRLGLDMPIVGTTANADLPERERCFQSGMHGLLIKPIGLKDLRSALLETLSVYRASTTETLQVSARFLPIFIDTMNEDLLRLTQELAEKSSMGCAALLHRISGALTVASAPKLADRGAEAEHELALDPIPPSAWKLTEEFVALLESSLLILNQAPTSPRRE